MKKNGLIKIFIAVLVLVALVCLLVACKDDPYQERPIDKLNENLYMQIDVDRLNFMVGMSVDTKEIIAKCGAKLVDDDGNEVNVVDYLDDGTVACEEFDLSKPGKDKTITMKFKNVERTITYDVTDFTVNFYLDDDRTNLWKAVKPNAVLTDDLKLSIYVDISAYNYSTDGAAREADAEGMTNRFDGWRDTVGNTITGLHAFSASPSGGTRIENLHAHFLSIENFQDMNLYYDTNGDRVFAGYKGEQIDTLRIPEGVTRIDLVKTFSAGFKFTRVNIPSTARMDVPFKAGINTAGLEAITVDKGNQAYASYAGALYSKDYKTLYLMPANCVDGIFHSALTTYDYYSCAYWKMDSFVLPESVMTLKDYAFAYSDLTAVGGIGRHGLNILNNVFFETNMKVREHVIDGKLVALYNSFTNDLDSGPFTLSMIVDKEIQGYKVIPNTTVIGGGVFRDCKDLVTIDLGDTIEKIGSSAFSGCISLRKIELPASLKYLGSAVFYGCEALSEVTGLGDVTALENNAEYEHTIPSRLFYGCNALVTVSYARGNALAVDNMGLAEGVKNVHEEAFYQCKSLPSPFKLPTTLERIETSAFRDCAKIRKVKFPESLSYIGETAFYNSGLESLHLSECPKVTELQSGSFRGTRLTSLTIPDYITEIPSECFYGLTALSELNMGKLKTIGDSAFRECTMLDTITWSEELTTIGNAAFYNCSRIKSVQFINVITIGRESFRGCRDLRLNAELDQNTGSYFISNDLGDKLTTIGDKAFMECTSMSKAYLPDSVVSVGLSTFSGCEKLTEVYLGAKVKSFGVYNRLLEDKISFENLDDPNQDGTAEPATFNANNLEKISVSVHNTNFMAHNGVLYGKEIGGVEYDNRQAVLYVVPPKYKPDRAFITSLPVQSYCKYIAPYAFKAQSIITDVILNEGLEIIGKAAFHESTSIKSIELPASLQTMSSGILLQSSITEVTINEGNETFTSDGNMIYNEVANQATLYIGKSGEAIIKDGITSINGGLFMRNSLITSVKIPDSVVSIGARAFYQCDNLTSIEIGSGLENLGDEGVWKLQKLRTIIISEDNPYMKAINGAVYSKDGKKLLCVAAANEMTSFAEIEAGVEEICAQAFEGHRTLEEVVLPTSVKIIGDRAFYDCKKLRKLVTTASLQEIGDHAFSFTAKSATDFRWNDELRSVTLYGGVNIKDGAFTGQYGIESVYFKMTFAELSEFNAKQWENKKFLVSGCEDKANNAFYNNGGRGVDKYIYSDDEPTVFLDGYTWFYFDDAGNPRIW